LLLHCPTIDVCGGMRQYRCHSDIRVARGRAGEEFVTYVCKNCSQSVKTFAVLLEAAVNTGDYSGQIRKYGEIPNFGPPTPPRLTRLLGDEKELFLKGRQAENQAMGIAAFAYYRRVIEHKKDAIFDEIIRVSEGISAAPEIILDLRSAKRQVQFTSAVDSIKHGIPEALMINGVNPLTLLHSALSEGLHEKSDSDASHWPLTCA